MSAFVRNFFRVMEISYHSFTDILLLDIQLFFMDDKNVYFIFSTHIVIELNE